MIQYDTIKRHVGIVDAARYYGIQVSRDNKACCPFHNDKHPSLSFKDNRFKCFACGASGDLFDLVGKLKDLDTLEAAQLIAQDWGLMKDVSTSSPVSSTQKKLLVDYSAYIDSCALSFKPSQRAKEYLASRGLTEESLKQFRLGYDAAHDAVVIPYGKVSSYYMTRCITSKSFYKPKAEEAGAEPLFYEESLSSGHPVFVTESPICAISIQQQGGNALSLCGTMGQAKLIAALKRQENAGPLILCLDNDGPGKMAAEKLASELDGLTYPYIHYNIAGEHKDPNEALVAEKEVFTARIQEAILLAEALPSRQVRQPLLLESPIQASGRITTLSALHPEDSSRYSWTDIGNSRLFADHYKDVTRFVPERKLWYCYDGKRWVPDTGNLKVMELCKALADALLEYAVTIREERQRIAYIDHFRRWQLRRNRETILKDAQGIYPISMEQFDIGPNLFNCANGTLDLKTMAFRPHVSGDMLTKLAQVCYDPEAHCERFQRFIREIMSGDEDRARFLQKALGYGLGGDTRYECLFILYGATTRNGKGTLAESVLKVIGDYGRTVRPESISLKQSSNGSGPTEDIARLAGIRLANISEPSRGLVLNVAQVKTMTGNDTLNARFLHENSFDFRPQFKIYINTNYLPVIHDMTLFSSGRVLIIPFEKHFEEDEQDKSLKREFAKEVNQSAILNWLVDGYRLLEAEGFSQPESVKAATERYRHDSDKIALFAEEALVTHPSSEVRTSEVYSRYQQWCSANGCHAENMRNFKQALMAIGHVEHKRPRNGGGATTLLVGYKLVSEDGMVPL